MERGSTERNVDHSTHLNEPQGKLKSMAHFFSYPLNYGSGRSQYKAVADNNYATFTAQTSMLLNIDSAGDGTGTARAFTDIFIKATGVESYTIALTDPEPSGLSFNDRTLLETVKNDSGDTVETTINGYRHDLHSLWTDESTAKPKAKAITLTFTAATRETARIYEIMILDRLLTLNSNGGFSRIEYDSLESGSYEDDLRGRRSYVPAIGGERDKWLVNLTLNSLRGTARDTIADELLHFIRGHKTFVFAPEYNRYPDRVFPAGWADAQTAIRYLSKWKGAGRRVNFSVREK